MSSDSHRMNPKSLANLRPWQKGQSGNPKGRIDGSRNKLAEEFLRVLAEDFKAHGAEAVRKVREERPQDYVKAVALILPKEHKVEYTLIQQVQEMSDEEILERLRQLGRPEPAEAEVPSDATAH
jgi:hypothetical protein